MRLPARRNRPSDEIATGQSAVAPHRENAPAGHPMGKFSAAPAPPVTEYPPSAPAAVANLPRASSLAQMQVESRAVVSGSMAMTMKAAPVNIVYSPDRSVAWQYGRSGKILRWTTSTGSVAQRSGVTTDLLAASAPSNDVCWMVGKSGTIIRTLDGGAHWQLVKPPSRQNFTTIIATDSNNASIATANGARFSTRDGGVTWSSP